MSEFTEYNLIPNPANADEVLLRIDITILKHRVENGDLELAAEAFEPKAGEPQSSYERIVDGINKFFFAAILHGHKKKIEAEAQEKIAEFKAIQKQE